MQNNSMYLRELSQKIVEDRVSVIKKMYKSCEWFNIPLKSMVESAGIGAGKG